MAPHAPAVLLVVLDGLRPDLVTPDRTPALSALLGDARVFPNASSVLPSIARVCAGSIGTGAPPGVDGVVQSAWPEPALFPDRFLDTARADDLRRAVAATGNGDAGPRVGPPHGCTRGFVPGRGPAAARIGPRSGPGTGRMVAPPRHARPSARPPAGPLPIGPAPPYR